MSSRWQRLASLAALALLVAAAPAARADSPLSRQLRRAGWVELSPPRFGDGAGTVVGLGGDREAVIASPDGPEAGCLPPELLPRPADRPPDLPRVVEADGAGAAELALARAAGPGVDLGAAFGDPRVRSIRVTLGEPFEQTVSPAALEDHLAGLSRDDPCRRELTRPGSYLIHRALGVRGVGYRFAGKRGVAVPFDAALRARTGLVTPPAGVRLLDDGLELAFPVVVGARYALIVPDLGFAGDTYQVVDTAPNRLPEATGRGGGTPQGGLPGFPWPPPRASATDVLPGDLLGAGPAAPAVLGEVDRRLTAALEATGYLERRYYAVPGGFAMVTRIEQIDDDGSPRPPPDRWSTEVPGMTEFSLGAYLRALFLAARGRYRVIVLVATDAPFPQHRETITAETAESWLVEGANVLPREVAEAPFPSDGRVTALIYELERVDTAERPELVVPSRLQGRDHLRRAGIWEALER
jgi:hypothetical protein